jgi:hypothetical protein
MAVESAVAQDTNVRKSGIKVAPAPRPAGSHVRAPLLTPLPPGARCTLQPFDNSPPIPVLRPRIVIGRDDDCDVSIASTAISSSHCEIRLEVDGWHVVDLGSKNGTQVNGIPVTDAVLRPGDRVTLSHQHRFEVDCAPVPHRTATPRRLTFLIALSLLAALAFFAIFWFAP